MAKLWLISKKSACPIEDRKSQNRPDGDALRDVELNATVSMIITSLIAKSRSILAANDWLGCKEAAIEMFSAIRLFDFFIQTPDS